MHVVYLLVHKLRQIWDGRLEFKEMIENDNYVTHSVSCGHAAMKISKDDDVTLQD